MNGIAEDVALACRVLARAGLASGSLGHVSARVGGGLAIRCRGPREAGLLFTAPEDVHVVDPVRPVAAPGWTPPHELPIHSALYRARPGVGAVVHVHAPAAVLCGLAGLELRPVFGAYDIPAARLALAGVPVFPRAALITRDDLGDAVAAAMGGADVCLLRGHGIATAGADVPAAVARALELERLARVTLELHRLGARPAELTAADRAELPDLGSGFDDGLVWAHHKQMDALASS